MSRSHGNSKDAGNVTAAHGATSDEQPEQSQKSCDTPDKPNQMPNFSPSRQPGAHLNEPLLRTTLNTAVEFFKLFFSVEIIKAICTHTNAYAWKVIANKPHYGKSDGSWKETCPKEIERLIAIIIIYFGLVKVNTTYCHWSVKTIYRGLWARQIMTRERSKPLMGVLHVVDPNTENPQDKLCKVSSFIQAFKDKCQSLYQPFQQIAIDERMVKLKHTSSIRQYIRNKPTKWGLKMWVLADSSNAYTCDFDVCIGKAAGRKVSEWGLGYDVVMKLIATLLD